MALSDTHTRLLVHGLKAFVALQVATFALNLALAPDMTKAEHASAVVLDQNGQWLRAIPVDGGRWRLRADLNRTDKSFVKRLIAIEDERFFWHLGVDPVSIVRAFGSNARAGSVVSGASTLSMQTARLLSPRERTYGAKFIEMLRALQLELRYSKSEILSIYLTLAPYGGNIEGVRAASLAWFGHEPETLTIDEQALLIALPQSPEVRRPDRHPMAAKAARNLVLERMFKAQLITRQNVIEASSSPIITIRHRFAAYGWHISERLVAQTKGMEASIISTIDAGLQTRLEAMASRTAIEQGPNSSVAIIVVDIKTRAVRASVGSGGLAREGGYIDMTQAIRSPGSALKPFIYGMGFDQGVVAPDTRLNDLPTRFGDYSPENFDKVFHGNISAKEALIHSLNIPAVAVLSRIGAEAFEARLGAAGVKLIRPKSELKSAGLALALGGEGIKLSDIVCLYAALGDDGILKPLVYRKDDEVRTGFDFGYRLMSAKAATQVLDILAETPPPEGRLPAPLIKGAMRPAFKTGTSYGFRDALAVGVAGGYAVLVWTGRPDGGARADQTGREASAPLLFDVFDELQAPHKQPPTIVPMAAPTGLQNFQSPDAGLTILFPPNNATLYVETSHREAGGKLTVKRPLKLSARGQRPIGWYVNGAPLYTDENGDFNWSPPTEGFYDLSVSDATGQSKRVTVRIKAIENQP